MTLRSQALSVKAALFVEIRKCYVRQRELLKWKVEALPWLWYHHHLHRGPGRGHRGGEGVGPMRAAPGTLGSRGTPFLASS